MENQTQLTVTDLANLHQLIDAAASRGAFRAGEMQQVGEVYNKLTAFLKSVADAQQAAPAGNADESTNQAQGETNA